MNNLVLIVDDMKENIDILMHALRDHYSVMAARSGEAAIKLMDRKPPDLVLMDVTMPGMDGFDVLTVMKKNDKLKNIPTIFITAEHDLYFEEKGITLGALDYIRKPFNTAVVNAKVRNHLELKKHRDYLELIANERTRQLRASRDAVIMGMSLLSEGYDRVASHHIERIKAYTTEMTKKIMELRPDILNPKRAELIVMFSPLHDVGKSGMPDDVINKQGRLTRDEMEVMKKHAKNGASILRNTDLFLMDDTTSDDINIAIEIAECHHERYDGSGYPYEMKGPEIPLSARIVALTDVYDALRSPRTYKHPLTHNEAIAAIFSGDERTIPMHFDPFVLEVFKDIHPLFDVIYTQNVHTNLSFCDNV